VSERSNTRPPERSAQVAEHKAALDQLAAQANAIALEAQRTTRVIEQERATHGR
jgi:hypothetical protein